MNRVEIRVAQKKDVGSIAALGRSTFTETFDHLFRDKNDLSEYCDRTFSAEKIERSIIKLTNIFWIALVNGVPAGYAKLKMHSESEFIKSKNVCQLQKIYVLKDFLSMKIGFELQNRLLTKARERKFEKIWLSVLNTNYRAIHFYEKNGFIAIGNHAFTIGKEHFQFMAMSKQLN